MNSWELNSIVSPCASIAFSKGLYNGVKRLLRWLTPNGPAGILHDAY